MVRNFSSVAGVATLTENVGSGGGLLKLSTAAGLPAPPFTLVIEPGTASEEIVTVTAISGLDVTVVRGQDGTPGVAHGISSEVRHMMTGRDLQEPHDHMSASSGVHGLTGAVVGTTDTQTLTNKIIDGNANAVINVVPVGGVIPYAGDTAPDGWLLCEGQAVDRTEYADLFAVLDTTYGAGNGTTTFNVPDMRGRVPVGFNSGETEFNALNKSGGAKTHTLTEAQMPSHTHVQNAHTHTQASHTHTQASHTHTSAAHTHTINHDHASVTSGSSGAHTHSINIASGNDYIVTHATTSGGNPSAGMNGGPHLFNWGNAVSIGSAGAHTHSVNLPNYTGNSGSTTPGATGSATPTINSTTATNNNTTATNQNTGGGQAHNNLQPFRTLQYIVKY